MTTRSKSASPSSPKHLQDVPDDVLSYKILNRLDEKSLVNLSVANTTFNEFFRRGKDNILRRKFETDYAIFTLKDAYSYIKNLEKHVDVRTNIEVKFNHIVEAIEESKMDIETIRQSAENIVHNTMNYQVREGSWTEGNSDDDKMVDVKISVDFYFDLMTRCNKRIKEKKKLEKQMMLSIFLYYMGNKLRSLNDIIGKQALRMVKMTNMDITALRQQKPKVKITPEVEAEYNKLAARLEKQNFRV